MLEHKVLLGMILHKLWILLHVYYFINVDKPTAQFILFQRFNTYKYHWSNNRVPVILEVNQGSLDQVDPSSNRVLCSYDYKDMEGLAVVYIQFIYKATHLVSVEAHHLEY